MASYSKISYDLYVYNVFIEVTAGSEGERYDYRLLKLWGYKKTIFIMMCDVTVETSC